MASACADCHADVHRATLGFDCQRCHTPRGWSDQQAVLELHAAALLPLTGAHATVECEACHRGGPAREMRAVAVECVGCHRDDYLRASPNHLQLAFPLDCQQCHDTTDSPTPTSVTTTGCSPSTAAATRVGTLHRLHPTAR